MANWSGEVKRPECNHWQIPMSYCPNCGYSFMDNQQFYTIKQEIKTDGLTETIDVKIVEAE